MHSYEYRSFLRHLRGGLEKGSSPWEFGMLVPSDSIQGIIMSNYCLARQHSVPLGHIAERISALKDSTDQLQTSCTNCGETASTENFEGCPDTTAKQHELVVHFDVNETILVGDEAGGDSVMDSLNKMLAKSAFVQVPEADRLSYNNDQSEFYEETSHIVPTHWWNGLPIHESRNSYDDHWKNQVPNDENDSSIVTIQEFVPPLYTGWDWPSHCVPYYRTRLRRNLGNNFCQHNGSIYAETLELMKTRLGLVRDGLDPNPSNENKLFCHLLPAFFETLHYLSTSRKDKWTIVFRTFGSDLSDIAEAVTAFARGRHPSYPNFRDDRLVMDKKLLFQGKWTKEMEGHELNDERKCPGHENWIYQLWDHDGNTLVALDEDKVLELLHDRNIHICGIRDDYDFWSKNKCHPWAGKPVWKPSDSEQIGKEAQHHHILFDDNIHNLRTDSIASVRSKVLASDRNGRHNGAGSPRYAPLTVSEIAEQQGIHLIRVPTVEPLLDSRWFIRQIQRAQMKFAAC